MRSAVVLAGGRSTRFGDRDKAVEPLAGVPMLRRVTDRVADVVDEVTVNCRVDQTAALREATADAPYPVRFAVDEEPDRGPMAGIMTGLRAAGGEYAFVVACDMPFVEPALAELLFERAAGRDAAIPRLDDEWYQTTQAVYRASTMADACEAALERGDRKILAPLDALDWAVVDEPEVRRVASLDSFENCNTREEFAAVEARIRRESPE